MATTKDLKLKLQLKLKELFQLDQPDLDFGFYRVMHAKQKEINEFLNEKLPQIISEAFKETDDEAIAAKKEAYEDAVRQAISFGAPDPESTEPVKAAKKVWLDAQKSAEGEADIYDHLYHFFERYYDKGDFISLRYLTRESDRKAQPYAIPYAGEEVKLHWANSDQYYIKTSENFSNYSFDAVQHPNVLKLDEMTRMAHSVPDKLKVHFSIVDAEEGEHGNIKDSKNRFFILHENKPCEIDENGQVNIYFEYREDPEKPSKEKNWQDKLRIKAIETLKQKDLPQFLFFNLNQEDDQGGERILLDVYLKRYFARNTQDYFIHKDLGGFLRRELDFYIKNELMQLDDVSAATPESVASWLNKVKVFREIASNIITFLAQLEDFQKKLWLKKKFVVQCDYCITMDRIPEQFKAEIYANEAQKAEWKRLGFDDIQIPDIGETSSSAQGELALDQPEPTTYTDYRMVDTRFFDELFKQRLIASVDQLDNKCDGILIYSENFAALNFLLAKFENILNAIYIDPPFNAPNSEILYKNNYKDSSWLSLINDRVRFCKKLLRDDGVFTSAIDDYEMPLLWLLLSDIYDGNHLGTISIRINPKGRMTSTKISAVHEFTLLFGKTDNAHVYKLPVKPEDKTHNYIQDKDGTWYCPVNLRKQGVDSDAEKADGSSADRWFPVFWNEETKQLNITPNGGEEIWPIDTNGLKRIWRRGKEDIEPMFLKGELWVQETPNGKQLYFKYRGGLDGEMIKSMWIEPECSASDYGTKILNNLFGEREIFDYPKAPYATMKNLRAMSDDLNACFLDCFGGSGTTGQSIIELNRIDNGHRKYILIEMGDHFNTVLKPRIEKVVYSPEWQDGKPLCSDKGISHCFKYMRLESYEDTLNNLAIDKARGEGFEGIEDYLLKYMLDIETAGSASLLNIKDFKDPFNYKLTVKKPASEERVEKTVDLVETFNYLMGLRVNHIAETKAFSAEFERKPDPELPGDAHTKLLVKNLRLDQNGQWKFRTVEGWIPRNRFTPNDGAIERVLVVWRTLSDDIEKDNAVLDAYLQRNDINALDGEYDVIYVNGSNNVPNLAKDGDTWKVRLIEEDFMARMWEGE